MNIFIALAGILLLFTVPKIMINTAKIEPYIPTSGTWDISKTVPRMAILTLYINNKVCKLINTTDEDMKLAKQIIKEYNISSPYEIHDKFSKYYKYISDPFFGIIDIQKSLGEFIRDGGGDCDDFAAAHCRLLTAMNIRCWYVTLYDPLITMSHTTAVFEYNGKIKAIDTYGYISPEFHSEQDIAVFYGNLLKRKYTAIDIRNCITFQEENIK